MHKPTIILIASFLLPILAAPVPVDQLVHRETSIVEPRRNNPVIGLASDVLKRWSKADPAPLSVVYDSDEESKRDVVEQEEADTEEDDDDVEELEIESELLEDRGILRRPGGNPKRGLVRVPGGSGKRGLLRKPGGNGKRGIIKGPGGGSKRGLIRKPSGSTRRGDVQEESSSDKRSLIQRAFNAVLG
ncbi:unnamed protein product [Alternaria alternata]